MAGNFNRGKDSFEISELAALNEDISDAFIEQLQNQLAESVNVFHNGNTEDESDAVNTINENDDTTLFEESPAPDEKSLSSVETSTAEDIPAPAETPVSSVQKTENSAELSALAESRPKREDVSVNTNFDDNFIKKYKAKLNKKSQSQAENKTSSTEKAANIEPEGEPDNGTQPIENISKGNITEKFLNAEQKKYNESLDFLDGNVKYSKYVIYIDPQNVDFIDGLTVKERKNLINGILRQQDDIAITKQRFKVIQTVLRQVIVVILTISIAVPLVYTAINASLEATIDNHRRSQTNWQTLYKEHGKITPH